MDDPQAAYIHVPFCRHRCGYCNFTLVAGREDLIDAYFQALAIELRELRERRSVSTLFIGGGTPSHLPPGALNRLLTLVEEWFQLSEDGEFSVEANPSDLTKLKIDQLADAGVNRLSLGVQSWNANKLAQLERDHRRDTIASACELARVRIHNLSIDLIFGTPGESRQVWQDDLQQTVNQQPQHTSTYGLTYERGTRFWSRRNKGELSAVCEADEIWMYETAMDTLSAAGFEHYEVSNFARPCFHCRHNEVYWSGNSYYAFGPGAARYLNGCREMNHRSTTTYIRRVLAGQSPVAESETLSREDRARERFVLGMRRMDGVNLDTFAHQTGITADELFGPVLAECCQHGLLERQASHIRLTRRGLILSDSIWSRLLIA